MNRRDKSGFVKIEENTMVIDISQKEWNNMYIKKFGGRPINSEALRNFASAYLRDVAHEREISPDNLRIKNLADEREE